MRPAFNNPDLCMAPKEHLNLPFRWEFVPVENPRDLSVCWRWRAYAHTGAVAMESEGTFDTLTECMNDARSEGYGGE